MLLFRVLTAAAMAVPSLALLGATESDVLRERQADLPEQEAGYVNAAYFVNWAGYERDYHPQDLPASSLTHVLYAFMDVGLNGTVFTRDVGADLEKEYEDDRRIEGSDDAHGCVKQLYLLKKANRKLKVILSIGGATLSTNFAAVAGSVETRSTFAESAVTLMKDWGFDGIDIDWEYPAEGDSDNMVLLIQAVRDKLDAYAAEFAPGHHFQLSIAAPAGSEHYSRLRLSKLARLLDHIYLMAYDYSGSWSSTVGHNANLYRNSDMPESTPFNTDDVARAYLAAGVPARKLVLGAPIYGRSFLDASGLGSSYSGIGLADYSLGSWMNGVWDYKVLPRPGAKVYYDEKAVACFSYDAATREFISFDTTHVLKEKALYVRKNGLGGIMFWEASADATGSRSLIETSSQSLSKLDNTENCLNYPDSRYRNIAKGMSGD